MAEGKRRQWGYENRIKMMLANAGEVMERRDETKYQ